MSESSNIKLFPMQPDQASICRRRAVAEARGMPPENAPAAPEPSAENRRRAAGRLAPMVLEHMAENGWQAMGIIPAATKLISEDILVNVPMRHLMGQVPDGDGDQPVNEPKEFEVLVRVPGPRHRVTVTSRGAGNAYYGELAAIAAVQQEPRDIMVAVYNSDDGDVALHHIPRKSMEEMKQEWTSTMLDLAREATQPDELPDPENAYDAPACRSCRYRLNCPAQQQPPVPEDPNLDEDAFAEALEQWQFANEKVGELRGYEKTREAQRDEMMKMMTENGITEMNFHDSSGQARLIKIGIQPRNSPNYKLLQEALSPAQFNEMIPKTTSRRFTVSKG